MEKPQPALQACLHRLAASDFPSLITLPTSIKPWLASDISSILHARHMKIARGHHSAMLLACIIQVGHSTFTHPDNNELATGLCCRGYFYYYDYYSTVSAYSLCIP